VDFAVRQDFGLEFLAKAKPLRPRPQSQGQGQPIARPAYCMAKATIFGLKAKAKDITATTHVIITP